MADEGKQGAAGKQRSDVRIGECRAESEVSKEALDRALGLLARWALRREQNVLEDVGINPGNRVTGGVIKGYGDKNELNWLDRLWE